jgi:4-hydroxybenzoate polyprenyltransferase/phosphoserine phosphatase
LCKFGNNMTVLACDLDGTLVKTDTLVETFLLLIKKNPLYIFILPFWLMKGKTVLKTEIAKRVELDPASLPYNDDVLEFLNEEKKKGRKIVLATAANKRIAGAVAKYWKLFDEVIASDAEMNVKGKSKAEILVKAYGEKGFDYIGDAKADLKIWKHADKALTVNVSRSIRGQIEKTTPVVKQFTYETNKLKHWFKQLRIYQWVKNGLLFLPLFLAHLWGDVDLWVLAGMAFFAFGLTASSVYLLNDLLDLRSDRLHKTKRNRPFAAGKIPPLAGVFAFPILLAAGFALATFVSLKFVLVLAGYYILTTAYSFILKKIYLMDIIVLAALYTTRIIAGGVATEVPISPWLASFSMFIFISLASVKRYVELMETPEGEKISGRGYRKEDLKLMAPFGLSCGMIAVFVFAFYTLGDDVNKLYSHANLVLMICPFLLYWIGRVWFLAGRGQMHDDPIVFAIKDRTSWVIISISITLLILATL